MRKYIPMQQQLWDIIPNSVIDQRVNSIPESIEDLISDKLWNHVQSAIRGRIIIALQLNSSAQPHWLQ